MTGISNGVIGSVGSIVGNTISSKEINVTKLSGDATQFNELYANTLSGDVIIGNTLLASNASI